MKCARALATVLLTCVIAGCATSVTMTGKSYPSVAPRKVKILFTEKPECQYEELAFLSTPMKWNQNVAVSSARESAAEIGADYVVIESVHKNSYNDASVFATAYKCGDVNREGVDVDSDG